MQNQNIGSKPLSEVKEKAKNEATKSELAIEDLGWSPEETKETYYRLLNFKEDWEAPGMEAYDDL
jgi:hypothetical protein